MILDISSGPTLTLCSEQIIDYSAATELVWSIFNVKKDQDVRIKLGYNVIDKVCSLSQSHS